MISCVYVKLIVIESDFSRCFTKHDVMVAYFRRMVNKSDVEL